MQNTLCDFYKEIFDRGKNEFILKDITEQRETTFSQFYYEVEQLAKGFIGNQFKKGTHIGLLAPNGLDWLSVFVAASEIGCIVVLLNTGLGEQELIYAIQHSDVEYLFTTTDLLDIFTEDVPRNDIIANTCKKIAGKLKNIYIIDNMCFHYGYEHSLDVFFNYRTSCNMKVLMKRKEEVEENDIATIQFTSGTTGNPKAVQMTHQSIVTNVKLTAENMGYTNGDKILLGTPLYHILGYIGTALPALYTGASLYVIHKFSTKKVLHEIQESKCTCFSGVPTLYEFLCNRLNEYNISTLKKGLIAGAQCTNEIINRCFHEMNLKDLVNIYGQTETLSIGMLSYNKNQINRDEGFTLHKGIQAKIVEQHTHKQLKNGKQGELYVKTKTAMYGYYKNDVATREVMKEGWIATGDMAVLNKNNKLYIKGRLGDVIIRGGENISATEVENQIRLHPFVKDVAVIGIPDRIYGQEVYAFVILQNGEKLEKAQLLSFLDEKAGNKKPKYINFIGEFPYTSSGKIRKVTLQEMITLEK